MRTISDAQRRARIGVRHALAQPVDTPLAAARSVVCLHATEPASIYLSAFARSGASRDTISQTLYDDRTLVRQLAMRRTVFAFPHELIPAVMGSAAPRVASMLGTRLAKEIEAGGLATDGARFLAHLSHEVRAACAGLPRTTAELREQIADLDLRIEMNPGKHYGGSFPIAQRVLSWLAADGVVLRGANETGWKTSRPRWTLVEDWLGEPIAPTSVSDGYVELVRAWLDRFGPGTEDDLVWWLGATKGAVRTALAALDAEPVRFDDGLTGYVLPDDRDDPEPDRWAALLPALDPTVMGWKQRDFYLGSHREHLFDTNGNGGPSILVDGRIVGGWRQHGDGTVDTMLIEKVDRTAIRLINDRAAELTDWLAGDVVNSIYQSPLVRRFNAAEDPA